MLVALDRTLLEELLTDESMSALEETLNASGLVKALHEALWCEEHGWEDAMVTPPGVALDVCWAQDENIAEVAVWVLGGPRPGARGLLCGSIEWNHLAPAIRWGMGRQDESARRAGWVAVAELVAERANEAEAAFRALWPGVVAEIAS